MYFFQKLSYITPYLITNNWLTDRAIDRRTEFNDFNTKISKFIEWQESEEGNKANLLEIEETQKDILFTDWDARIKQVQLAVMREAGVSKKIIKEVNHTMFATNLIKEGNLK